MLIKVDTSELGITPNIYINNSPVFGPSSYEARFCVPVPMSCLTEKQLKGLNVKYFQDKGYVIAKSTLRPPIIHARPDDLVRDLQRLDALNMSRDTYFKDRVLWVHVEKFEIPLNVAVNSYQTRGISHGLVLQNVEVIL